MGAARGRMGWHLGLWVARGFVGGTWACGWHLGLWVVLGPVVALGLVGGTWACGRHWGLEKLAAATGLEKLVVATLWSGGGSVERWWLWGAVVALGSGGARLS